MGSAKARARFSLFPTSLPRPAPRGTGPAAELGVQDPASVTCHCVTMARLSAPPHAFQQGRALISFHEALTMCWTLCLH